MSGIELRGVARRFAATTVLDGLDLSVPDRSITALLGESGSGKSTILRIIAGFDRPDAGEVIIGDRVVDDGRRHVRSQHRRVGYVPQEAGLFPHLTVRANIGFGVSRQDRDRLDGLIAITGLEGLDRRFPHQLSGGQQQRVALARALAIEPRVVLLDEPFSSLDATLREQLRRDVVRILGETQTTAILVTHDQDEALSVADQVAVLQGGKLLAASPPRDLYRRPSDLDAGATVGAANLLAVELHGSVARSSIGDLALDPPSAPADGRPGRVLVRPEQLEVATVATDGAVRARVTDCRYQGYEALLRVELDTGGAALLARVGGETPIEPGQRLWVRPGREPVAWEDGTR